MKEKYFNKLKNLLKNSYSPYSGLRVGAILISEDDKEFKGVNVENVSFGLTICAERAALFNAVAAGKKKFKKIFILSSSDQIIYPCGACLQVLSEFVDNSFRIVLFSRNGKEKTYKITELLKKPFNK
ncbi:MAG: cytidine deaminase [Candidatus Mcinerneyibacterium aminivorans]|uniref:Cytidine deaminase n=1 Tax=Candidatus Mcinerneyibacterium aminivorans TaxID=2703815 RepID=A0A5D0ML87_9BACT|nr:MAG: cytidine deaminase [Candidatus Mcinerneyibacterium aminivorans]